MTQDAPEPPPEAPPDLVPQPAPRRNQRATERQIQLPPHSIEAEQGLLGSILLDPAEVIGLAIEKLHGGPDAFYDLRHRDIYGAMVGLHSAGKPIDEITVFEWLKASGRHETSGGLAYIAGLSETTPAASHAEYYVGLLSDKLRSRKLLGVCSAAVEAIHAGADGPDALIESVERQVFSIRDASGTFEDSSAHDLSLTSMRDIEDRLRGTIKALSTGFKNLDATLRGGLRPGKVYVVAARPGAGKTAFAVCTMLNVAATGTAVGFVSLEMEKDEIRDRCLSVLAQVDFGCFDEHNTPTEQQCRAIAIANSRFSKLPIRFDDKPERTVASIRALARRWKSRHGIGLLCIDYLQLVSGTRDGRDRREEVDAISKGLKSVSKELALPVLLLAQLNRDIEKERGRKPRLSDLRESGAIEQDADFVGFLYEPKAKDEDDRAELDPNAPREVRMLVAKQRSGPKGADLRFVFHPPQTRFEEARRTTIEPND